MQRREVLKHAAAILLATSLLRFDPAFAMPGDFGDDDSPWGDDDGGWDDSGDDESDPPDPPEKAHVDDENSGGLGDDDRSLIDLATGSKSYDGPLSAQATAGPGQFVDWLFSGLSFMKSQNSESSTEAGESQDGRLVSQATSLARPGGGDLDEKNILSIGLEIGGEAEIKTDLGVGGFLIQTSPELNSVTGTGFAGEGGGFWLSVTAMNSNGDTSYEAAGGLFVGLNVDGSAFVGVTTEPGLEVGVMAGGQAAFMDISGPALKDAFMDAVVSPAAEYLQRGVESLYSVPRP